jgi:hypothetical protein
MKKKFIIAAILIVLTLLAPRLFILSMASWNYSQATENCTSPGSIISVRPYAVMTTHGKMYPGDEDELTGEGAWYGLTTLLYAGKNGAVLYRIYPVDDPVKGHLRIGCRVFLPVGDY